MGRLVVTMFMTLDQVMQGPGRLEEDDEGGFMQGGWQAPFVDGEAGRVITEQVLEADALLIGRKTYDIFASYWPEVPVDDIIGGHLNRIPKYVASRADLTPDWGGTTVIRDIPQDVVAAKRAHGEIRVIGSGDLLQTLLAHDLVDGLTLWLYPVVLGNGKRVFRDGAMPTAFELAAAPVGFSSGSVLLVYRHRGRPEYGNL